MKEFMSSVPGIDEATSFGEVIKSLDTYKFDLVIFDTAPTGHTLRLLNFPHILDKALLKMIQMIGGTHKSSQPIIEIAKTTTAISMVIPKLSDSRTW